MNPYASPEGRIEDMARSARPKRGVAIWLPLIVCVLHSLFFGVVLVLGSVIACVDAGSLSPLRMFIDRPTVLLFPSLTLVAAWTLYGRKRITLLPLACLPIVIATHFPSLQAQALTAYFIGSLVLPLYVLALIVFKKLG
ncbi:MAG TPA: hypothetical protein DCR35_19750 [Runella sp.]|nr:hypothetical protein [Runella sp.]